MNQRRWGAVLSYVNIVVNMVIGLVYTPVMLRLLGQSEYGLYSLIGSVVGYLSVLDMGLGNTIVRYTAKNRIDGTPQREAELNGLFLGVYSLIGLLCLGIGTVLYINIDNLFAGTLTVDEMYRARIMMILLICNVAFSFPLSIFASILNAYEKFIFLRVSNILRVIINPLLVLPFLYWGYGSVMMVVVSTLLNFTCLFANAFYCFYYLHVRFSWGEFETVFLKEIIAYSFFIFLNAIMDKIYWGSGQFVLGIVSGTEQVAIYAIAMQFMMMYMNFSTAISGVMLPKVTMMVTNKVHISELSWLMTRIGRLQYLVVGYIFVMFFLVGRQFISLWAGSDYLEAYPIIMLLMFALMIPLVQNVGVTILQAMNLNRYRMTVYSICAFLAFVASFPLARYWNGWGCAFATAIALIVSTGFFMNYYYAIHIQLDIKMFWKNILSLAKGSVLLIAFGIVIEYYLQLSLNWHNFVVLCVIDTLCYIIIMYKFCMNEYEKDLCQRAYKKFLQIA